MSRIGKQTIILPDTVKVEVGERTVTVTGPKGSLTQKLPRNIVVEVKDGAISVSRKGESPKARAMHGTIRALLNNMVKGVSEGWMRQLELVGTGFRAEANGNNLTLVVGYSHPVKVTAPEGITFKVEKMVVSVEGIDKEVVGQIAADVRKVRPPEPYKGRGIKYIDEVIRRKAGKAAAKTTTA